MNGTQRQVAALDALVRLGSFGRAAKYLGLSERTTKRLVYDLRDLNGCRSLLELAVIRDRERKTAA